MAIRIIIPIMIVMALILRRCPVAPRCGERTCWHPCPLNPATKKPKTMYPKAIVGSDSLYVVQYAYRRALSQALVGPAVEYLRQMPACGTRRAPRRCPAGM